MCYTSGTTGHPKGVVYTHRALFLHIMAMTMADTFALSESDVILHVVPMFHANAWCVPHAGVMVGATQIFAGPDPQPRDLCELVQAERVTFTGAVPTVWIAVKELVEKEGYDLSSLRCVPCGGSAVPRSLMEYYEQKLDVPILQAWGMTETTPIGTIGRLKSELQRASQTSSATPSAPSRATSRPGSTSASWTTRGASSRGTAGAWARSRCAGPG